MKYCKGIANVKKERGSVVSGLSDEEFHEFMDKLSYRMNLQGEQGAFVEIVSKETRLCMTGEQWQLIQAWAEAEQITEHEMLQCVFDEGMYSLVKKWQRNEEESEQ